MPPPPGRSPAAARRPAAPGPAALLPRLAHLLPRVVAQLAVEDPAPGEIGRDGRHLRLLLRSGRGWTGGDAGGEHESTGKKHRSQRQGTLLPPRLVGRPGVAPAPRIRRHLARTFRKESANLVTISVTDDNPCRPLSDSKAVEGRLRSHPELSQPLKENAHPTCGVTRITPWARSLHSGPVTSPVAEARPLQTEQTGIEAPTEGRDVPEEQDDRHARRAAAGGEQGRSLAAPGCAELPGAEGGHLAQGPRPPRVRQGRGDHRPARAAARPPVDRPRPPDDRSRHHQDHPRGDGEDAQGLPLSRRAPR